MANMSYCRFQNTVVDLQDCFDHIDDEDLSKEENRARTHLVTVCRQIAAMFDDEAGDSFDELEERIATLNAAITDSQAYNKELVGQLAKKQNENNQLQERLEAAVARIKELETQVQFLGDRLQSIAMTDVDVATGRTYSEGCKL